MKSEDFKKIGLYIIKQGTLSLLTAAAITAGGMLIKGHDIRKINIDDILN